MFKKAKEKNTALRQKTGSRRMSAYINCGKYPRGRRGKEPWPANWNLRRGLLHGRIGQLVRPPPCFFLLLSSLSLRRAVETCQAVTPFREKNVDPVWIISPSSDLRVECFSIIPLCVMAAYTGHVQYHRPMGFSHVRRRLDRILDIERTSERREG